MRIDPVPSREFLSGYYGLHYRQDYKGVREPKAKHVFRAGRLALARFAKLREYLPADGAVLDIGSGGGEWLYVLRAAGVDARGIEVDAGYSAFAARELQVNIETSSLWDVEFCAGEFGAITMFHVLEHLPDPVTSLVRCARWLRTEGNLIIEVPNIASVHQHPNKRFHPAHLYGFTPATLKLTGERAGLSPVHIEVDEFDRNILAVFRSGPHTGGSAPSNEGLACRPEAGSLTKYYLLPQTYIRWFRRLGRFGAELRAVRGRKAGRDLLQEIVSEAGFPLR